MHGIMMQLMPGEGPATANIKNSAATTTNTEGGTAAIFEAMLAKLLVSGMITSEGSGTVEENPESADEASTEEATCEILSCLPPPIPEVTAGTAEGLLPEVDAESTQAGLPEVETELAMATPSEEKTAVAMPLKGETAAVQSAVVSEEVLVEEVKPELKPLPEAAIKATEKTPPPDTGASAPKGADPVTRVVPEALLKAHGVLPAEDGDEAVASPIPVEEEGTVEIVQASKAGHPQKPAPTTGAGRVHAQPQLEATSRNSAAPPAQAQAVEQAGSAQASAESAEEVEAAESLPREAKSATPRPAEQALLRAAEHSAVGRIAEGMPEGDSTLKPSLMQPLAEVATIAERPAVTTSPTATLESSLPQGPTQESRLETLAAHTVRNVRYLISDKGQTITVRLVPESLGTMHLEVQAHQDEISVRLVSANPMVRETLELNSQGIREALAREGIDVTRVEISATLDQQHAPADSRQGAASDTAQRAQQASSFQQFIAGKSLETLDPKPYHPKHEGNLNVFV